ncbi:serine hydrolase domain-containing protein [Kineococcus sp. NPDC059986]|jgi:CubicO group peptidase (beta-lactamase class C family)|uniref:serine hydrolase domain-containing protein n=1 Tax=Kineococcus sp. NPDC059986 TaxID=3155538 RepID=UPI00344F354D
MTGELTELLERWVRDGLVAGAVALVERPADGAGDAAAGPAVVCAGVADLATGRLVTPDTVFRWASTTKPLTAAAALTLVQDGAVALDDPVTRWLPELRDLRVLRTPTADLDDTVPADRDVTVRDLLTSTCGWGFPSSFEGPWVQALFRWQNGLEVADVPPPDRWLRGLAAVPLRHQPGAQFLYNTSYDVLGVLLARVDGRPLPDVLLDRLLAPLGLRDTGFAVRDDQRDRASAAYRATADGLVEFDGTDGRWSAAPVFPSGAGGLVGTAGDWWTFARELLHPGRVLTAESVRFLTTDRLGAGRAQEAELFLDGAGWGCGGSVDPATGRYGWVGGTGTSAHVLPADSSVAVLMTQTLVDSPRPPTFLQEFWSAAW